MFTIEQISKQTGLSLSVIRKAINYLKPLLEPYIQRGENNRIFFTSAGFKIWDNIKQYKEQGMALPSIKKELEKIHKPGSETDETISKEEKEDIEKGRANLERVGDTNQASRKNEDALFNKLLNAHEQIILEKEQRNKDMVKHVETTSNLYNELAEANKKLMLLPAGKTPEQIAKDLKEAEGTATEALRRAEEYKKDLIMAGKSGFFKRRKILKKWKKLK